MCLLVHQKETTHFTDAFLNDVYGKNRDGIGIMFATAGNVVVKKALPANAAEFVEFYRQYAEGRECIWHARMQTHGDIDLENCHPYYVTKNIWMAHNGILSSGNDNDRSKSDTWHFIANVIQPALSYQPDLILSPTYQAFIGDLIGNTNKFGFMTGSGEAVIINRSAGVTFSDAWLSNTYAWTPSMHGFQGATKSYRGYGYSGLGNDYLDWDMSTLYPSGRVKSVTVKNKVVDSKESIRPILKAAYNSWLNNNLDQWVLDAPWKASALLAYCYEDETYVEEMVSDDPSQASEWIEDLFVNENITPSTL